MTAGVPLDPGLIAFRSLRGCEKEAIRDFYGHLSPRSRYLRFFSPMPALPDAVLSRVACGDDRSRLTLFAELPRRDGAEIVAVGNIGAGDDGAAELALVVRDEYQRQGIGTALAARALLEAETRGLDRFVAYVLWDNVTVIRRLLAHVADVVSAKMGHGVAEMHFVRRSG